MFIKRWFLIVLLFPFAASAQMGYGGRGGMGGGMGSGMGGGSQPDSKSYTNICRISGKVMDSTGAPLKDVTIILQQLDHEPNPMAQPDDKPEDPYYKEMTTKKNGKFTFTSLPFFHEYKVTIMADGFKRWEQDVRFIPKKNEKKIPFEQMKPDSIPVQEPPRSKPSPEKDLGDIKLIPIVAKQ